jgi:hypothetical protein
MDCAFPSKTEGDQCQVFNFSICQKAGGKFVSFPTRNSKAQNVPGKARLGTVLITRVLGFVCHFPPIFGPSNALDDKSVTLKVTRIEQSQQGRNNSGVKVGAFPQRPFFILGRRAPEAFAEK